MADWFKLHENWFTEPRLQWAIKEQATVVQVWLWALTECCRTKSDTIGLHSEDYELIGIQQLLNLSPGFFNQGLNLLEKIKYIERDFDLKTIKVLKWNDFQSDYLIKKSRRKSDTVRQSPTLSDNVRLEERREEENREEVKKAKKTPFQKPTEEEATVYSKEISLPSSEVQGFLNHHEARGWILNNGKLMVDWKAAMRTWKGNAEKFGRIPKDSEKKDYSIGTGCFAPDYGKEEAK